MTEKKRRRRKEARPEEIISAAMQEFADKGYAGTSIGSIASRADIARSTVYLYFPDKEAVIRQAFEDRIGGVFSGLRSRPTLPDMPFAELFKMMLKIVYGRMTEGDNLVLLKVLVSEGQQFPELLKYYHANILKNGERLLTSLLERAIEKGEVRREVADYDPKIIIAPFVLAGLWHITFNEIQPLDIPRFVDGHVNILLKGLLESKPSVD